MQTTPVNVLTSTEIRNLRHYVHNKYAGLPNERRAEILADAMQRIVLRQLPAYPPDIRYKLTGRLLRDIIAAERLPVCTEHIFSASLSLDLERPELFEALHAWTEQRIGIFIDVDVFRRLLAEAVEAAKTPQSGTTWSILVELASMHKREISVHYVKRRSEPGQVVHFPLTIRRPRVSSVLYSLLSAVLVTTTLLYGWSELSPAPISRLQPPIVVRPVMPLKTLDLNGLPAELRYSEVNRSRLLEYLRIKSSLLAERPYFEAIMSTAKNMNIHPLLLFAITGQEQAFVPKDHKQAKRIANNPFNVFHSWKEYNTTIEQSANIAARTILRISKDRPEGKDALTWINREYAEDPNWSKGVRSIMEAMKRYIDTSER
ncbi:hypothetical protein KZ483_13675 [Paenibacillus sp. sptzw28]|uniref:hypothetical protein n=1 Tax=Paenibacillus sp. sptzw28 TaxID=715179 RepID=UPI001C6E2855|nr:hypothetical protein [Paenibacillus sp. sptzw28]QYR19028.1 hypothetical protein KZ483_13675 [Paenibacillus sp. sptzw28]